MRKGIDKEYFRCYNTDKQLNNRSNIETNIETYNTETGAWEIYKENNNSVFEEPEIDIN